MVAGGSLDVGVSLKCYSPTFQGALRFFFSLRKALLDTVAALVMLRVIGHSGSFEGVAISTQMEVGPLCRKGVKMQLKCHAWDFLRIDMSGTIHTGLSVGLRGRHTQRVRA